LSETETEDEFYILSYENTKEKERIKKQRSAKYYTENNRLTNTKP